MKLSRRRLIAQSFGFGIAIAIGATALADYSVQNEGTWPKDWPKELEPLRKGARTLEGSLTNLAIYEIRFDDREKFEAAWPHMLKVKSPGAPIILLRSPNNWLGKIKAGVRIRAPQTGNFVSPVGAIHPSNAKLPPQYLRIGPPWPKYIQTKEGGVPSILFNKKGKWEVYTPGTIRELGIWARTEIQLIVDGEIVDLNRIRLPKNTPIVDQRFEKK